MNRSESFPALVDQRVLPGVTARNVMLVLAASLVIALSAQVAIPLPLSPVPMTMQPLAVLLVGAALGARRGFAAALLYLAEGASGLPFFAGGLGGPLVLAGPTAGYLAAFPLAAGIAGFFSDRGWTRPVAAAVASLTFALTVLYVSGWGWLVVGMKLDPQVAFATGVLPFLLADAVKVVIAALMLPAAHRMLRSN